MADFDVQRKLRMEAMQDKKKRLEELKKMRQERAGGAGSGGTEGAGASAPGTAAADKDLQQRQKEADVDSILSSIIREPATAQQEAPSVGSEAAQNGDGSGGESASAALERRRQALTTVAPSVIFSVEPASAPAAMVTYAKEVQTDDLGGEEKGDRGWGDDDEEAGNRTPRGSSLHRKHSFSSTPHKRGHSFASAGTGHDDSEVGLLAVAAQRTQAAAAAAAAVAGTGTGEAALNAVSNDSFLTFLRTTCSRVERALAQGGGDVLLRDYRSPSAAELARNVGGGADGSDKASALAAGVAVIWDGAAVSVAGEDLLRGRPVMSISGSEQHRELYLVAYGPREVRGGSGSGSGSGSDGGLMGGQDLQQQDGVLAVWSTFSPAHPEMLLQCSSSPVLVAKFSPFNSRHVFGGCYNGQLVMWDVSSNANGAPRMAGSSSYLHFLPLQRSSLSAKGCHRCPIVDFVVIDRASSNGNADGRGAGGSQQQQVELISISTDGQICHWDLQSLSLVEPSRSYMRAAADGQIGRALATLSCASFSPSIGVVSADGDSAGAQTSLDTHLFLGTELGQLVAATVSLSGAGSQSLTAGAHRGKSVTEIEAHASMVTGMHLHPSHSADAGGLVRASAGRLRSLLLTISFDWRIKLWDLADAAGAGAGKTAGRSLAKTVDKGAAQKGHGGSLVIDFGNPLYDYICDVQWSPVHPALFATISSNNRLYLWNILASTAEPIQVVNIPCAVEPGVTVALTKLQWNESGKVIFVSNSVGVVYAASLRDSVALPSSVAVEEHKLETLVAQQKQLGVK